MRLCVPLPAFVMAAGLFAASEASACRCQDMSDEERLAKATLVVKGRIKSVTYGVDMPTGNADGETARVARGDFEIENVVKGQFDEKTVQIYTGSGLGDCGRLEEFLHAAIFYEKPDFGPLEFGLTKNQINGQTYYSSLICDYAKYPDDHDK